jgi:hypothetical protein
MVVSAVDALVFIILGWPVEPVLPVIKGKKSNYIFFTGKRANGQQNKALNLFKIASNEFSK